MQIILSIQAIKDNLQHIAGLIVGTVTSKQYNKDMRGSQWFSTVAVQLAQNKIYQWFPYKMIVIK